MYVCEKKDVLNEKNNSKYGNKKRKEKMKLDVKEEGRGDGTYTNSNKYIYTLLYSFTQLYQTVGPISPGYCGGCAVFFMPKTKLNSAALVRERTIPIERPPLVGEVSANFCGYRVSRGLRNGFPRSLISVF
jgi:hypothetical protein